MQPQSNSRPLALNLTLAAFLGRLVPHLPNFTPLGGASLFAGARLAGRNALLVPLAAMLISDPLLGALYGFHPFSGVTLFVYASFCINVFIGRTLRRSEAPLRIGSAAVLGSVQFFLLTNGGVWLLGSLYPATLSGLGACYLAALPFFAPTLAADLVYSGILFGLQAWASRKWFSSERVVPSLDARAQG